MEPEVRELLEAFGAALVAQDAKQVARLLAPWLSAEDLRAAIDEQVDELVELSDAVKGPPVGVDVDGNSSGYDDLKDGHGFPPDVTAKNFVKWGCLQLLAHEDSGIDAWMDLWVAVVRTGDDLRIGHFEVMDPD
jgi:hypothetical protein